MDKNAIKKYAVWARRELISRVSQRAALYEITDKGYGDASADSVLGRVMSAEEKRQRQALITQIRGKGYEQVMEEIAYTWFNRFISLRFMEVNGYLPARVRVFTDDENNFKPQILSEAINMELDGLDMVKVYALKNANDDDALFKYMIIVQCNALSSILPGMFQHISDYTELLFPDNLLREGSVIEQMVTTIPEEDWTDQVQIIGWLYEAYNSERNELVYDGNMSKSRIAKDLLPAATTIFTPDWPIRYMVENSLGRMWIEGHPNDELKSTWKYYVDEAEQEPETLVQLAEIRKEYAVLKPEDILAIDPCQGSGHILTYIFDVLVQIYEAYGYNTRDAVASIVKYNIWGLDIDDRAAQLAYFSIMMKARQYDHRFFSRGIQPHVFAIQESNNLDTHCIDYFIDGRDELKEAMDSLCDDLYDGKEYGSIIRVRDVDFPKLYQRFAEIENEQEPSLYSEYITTTLLSFVRVAEAMSKQYHIVVTNPPYLSNARFSPKLDAYAKKHYPVEKSDLSMVMLKRSLEGFVKENCFVSFITTSSWMFLASFEKMRTDLNDSTTILSLVDYGTELFEGKVGHNPIVSWVSLRNHIDYSMSAVRLVDYCYSQRDRKEPEFFNSANRFVARQRNFSLIPGAPIAYWVSGGFFAAYENGEKLGDFSDVSEGIKTGDNDRYLRYWTEIDSTKFSFARSDRGYKWYPHHKGGDYRKWYGNQEWVINWEDDGREIRNASNSGLQGKKMYFGEFAGWSKISSKGNPLRYFERNVLFDSGAPSIANNRLKECIALINSVVGAYFLNVISPTLNLQVGDVKSIPLLDGVGESESLVNQCIALSKQDWDSFETSWEFSKHPLIKNTSSIEDAFKSWSDECNIRFSTLKKIEEKINLLFIQRYNLFDVLTAEESEKDITVRKAELSRDIRSFISYAVGCMFGRYSLDEPGLVYAGGKWISSKYTTFQPDKDAIIPICDDEYFEDDIVGRFVKFVEAVYGKETLEENLRFIADAFGGKGSPREVIRNYFINDFYTDHLKIYQKRPIYWLFDSGKKNGFKCLIYMHRYQPDTIARIRTDYVHEQQSRYRTAIADLESRIANAGTGERVKLSKQLIKLQEQAEELRVYEEKIHHLADQMVRIDLDDGVKHNYAIFQDVLAKIK